MQTGKNRLFLILLLAALALTVTSFMAACTSQVKTTPMVAEGHGHSLALKNDGTVWAWGWNRDGELGDGTTTQKNTPIQVVGKDGKGSLTGVKTIASGKSHSFAIKDDGTVWAWGRDRDGELGDGTRTNRNTPVQVKDQGGAGYLNLGSTGKDPFPR
jgi:alpha-tubulin suppressor-like RCC1 family protein